MHHLLSKSRFSWKVLRLLRLMTDSAFIQLAIFVIGWERYNPIQIVAEQTILPSFQRMRDSGTFRFILGRDFFTLLS
jgi:hypothetical protein